MERLINKSAILAAFAVALLLLTGCVKEQEARLSKDAKINVRVLDTMTKAADDALPGKFISERVVASFDGYELVETVYENEIQLFGPQTKGEVMTTDKLQEFNMMAYADAEWFDNTIASGDGSKDSPYPAGLYFDDVTVSRTGTGSEWDKDLDENWLNGVPISFWSWNGVKPEVVMNTETGRYDKATVSDFTVDGTVTLQIDPIFAYNGESRTFNDTGIITGHTTTNNGYTRDDNEVDIHFYHALAAINFDISQVGLGNVVENIKLSGVYPGGDCSIEVDGGIPQFTWSPEGTKTYFSQSFESTDFNSEGRQPLETSGKVFLMIPQELSSDATITVMFSGTDSAPKQIYLKGSPDGTTPVVWEAGKYYTYAIKRSGDVQLDIMDNLTPVDAATVDAHYENAILRFSKFAPTSAKVTVTKPDGTTSDFNPIEVASTPAYANWIEFAAPASTTEYNSYPGSGSTVDIKDLFTELSKTDPTDGGIFIDDGGYYYTQAFINEYVDGSVSNFVGKNDRKFQIAISKNSTVASEDPSVELGQKAMQSPYNLLSAANPFGVEVIEDNTVTAGTSAADWCMSRNRDEDGNGTIEGSEIKWRVPSLQEYWNIWYGTHGMSSESWLGLSTSKGRTQYLSSDGLAYNGLLSTTIATPSGTGTVRCIRDLGSGSNLMYSFAEVPGNLNDGETTTKYVLTMNNISSSSMRSKISSNELTAGTINPGAGDDAEHNKLYSKIQVASQYLTWPTGNTVTVPQLLYYLAVEKDREKSIDDYYFYVEYNSSGNITLIEGRVKMINPDPRLVYKSSFNGTTGGVSPSSEWSYLDNSGVLHFNASFSGWSANNSGCKWDIKAAINNGDGTTTDLSDGKICTLVFYVNGDTKKGFDAAWGGPFDVNKVGTVTLIGDNCTSLGSSGRYCRLGVLDGGPYTLTNVVFPEYSEEYDGSSEKVDDKQSAEYLCKNNYYEDKRTNNGALIKGDLGTWRAPSQRELSIMLANRTNLKISKAVPNGTGEYEWSLIDWATTDKVFSPRITYSDGANSYRYYNYNSYLSTGGSDQAPYKVRCVRDIE